MAYGHADCDRGAGHTACGAPGLPLGFGMDSDMAARAEDVQTAHAWREDPFGAGRRDWTDILSKHRGWFALGLAAIVLTLGWQLRGRNYLSAEEGVGYALGIVSVACILVLLLYPLRKRFKVLRFLGPLPKWFRNHMILGGIAPIAALYHCNFQLGSLNSRIALFSALIVAGSGLIGRFIYSKIHRGLFGRKSNLKELLAQVKFTAPGEGVLGSFLPELMERLATFDRKVMVPPQGLFDCFRLPLVLFIKTRLQYFKLARFTRISLRYQAQRSTVVAQHHAQLERAVCRFIATHLRRVRRVAEFTAYDRLFALWHKVHVPFFVSLVVSVIVHIFVVHLY